MTKNAKGRSAGFIKKFLFIFDRRQLATMLCLALLSLVLALFQTGVTALMLPFMNALLASSNSTMPWFDALLIKIFGDFAAEKKVLCVSLLLMGGYVVSGVMTIVSAYVNNRFVMRSRTNLSARLFDCYLKKPYAYHTRTNSANILRAVTSDVASLYYMVLRVIMIVSEVVVVLSMFTVMTLMNPRLMLLLAGLMLITLLLVNLKLRKYIKYLGNQGRLKGVDMLKWVTQATGGLKNVIASRRQQFFVNQYTHNAQEAAQVNARFEMFNRLPSVVVETVAMSGTFITMGVLSVSSGDASAMLPTLATFALAAVRIIPAVNRINQYYNDVNYSVYSLDLIYDVLRESEVRVDTDAPLFLPERPRANNAPLRDGVRVSDMSFAFPDAKEPLFSDVSLFIPAKKSVAFIGKTGAGKTTLADILLGLQTPGKGVITADGRDIHQAPEWWADLIGYVPQSVYLFDDTVRANVAFGFSQADIDDQDIWRCLDKAQMKEYIESLPDGLDTRCGESGVRFSGGQRQRIGIARALYGDPQFLVLDEATSALDNDTEKAIMEAIDVLSGEKTLLIIAHRLSTIQNCDVIYRIENGRVTVERSNIPDIAEAGAQ